MICRNKSLGLPHRDEGVSQHVIINKLKKLDNYNKSTETIKTSGEISRCLEMSRDITAGQELSHEMQKTISVSSCPYSSYIPLELYTVHMHYYTCFLCTAPRLVVALCPCTCTHTWCPHSRSPHTYTAQPLLVEYSSPSPCIPVILSHVSTPCI